jgi:hypothetical protein
MTDFFINDPFEICEQRWPVHYPHLSASSNQFRQVAKRLGVTLEEADEAVLESSLKPPSSERAEVLYVQNDGALVSMQNGEWREVKSAVLFTDDKHCREGWPPGEFKFRLRALWCVPLSGERPDERLGRAPGQ